MLTDDQARFVADHFDSVDHDYYLLSGIWGEPFLCDDIMCYFDGETLQVVGGPMGDAGPTGATRVGAVIRDWARDDRVWFVNYYGPCDLAAPGGDWTLVYSCPPRNWNRELFIALPHHIRASDARRLGRRGYRTWVGRREFLSHEHLRLLRTLARRDSFLASDVGSLTNVASILRGQPTTMFEAHAGGELAGFLVAHDFFPRRPLFVTAAFDSSRAGVSDLLYHVAFEYYAERGAREVGLGYAVDEGLFRYKAKWGIARCGPPAFQFIWQREACGEAFNDCLYWPWRFLTGKLPRGQLTDPLGS
jgi:hypothetical protein